MREDLDSLIREATLVAVALGIALGWSLFQVARGFSETVGTLLTDFPGSEFGDVSSGQPLSWDVGHRVLTLWPPVSGLIELGIVLAVAIVVLRRRPTG